ncbi:MAG: type I secretion system permease/ATPase [Motiliproteus sp.]
MSVVIQQDSIIHSPSLADSLEQAANFFELTPASFYDVTRLERDEALLFAALYACLETHFVISAASRLTQHGGYLLIDDQGQVAFTVLTEGECGMDLESGQQALYLTRKNTRNSEGKLRRNLKNHWFWGAILDNKLTYFQVALAAVFINLFALASSLFIMTVYDRVIPHDAIDSLIALTLGIGLLLVFDFVLKMLRASFIDHAGVRIDRRIATDMYDNLIHGRLATSKHSTGGLSSVLREFEGLKDMFASATVVALVDLPFILFFIWVVYLVGGSIALVPLVLVPLVLLAGLLIQPLLAKYTRESYEEGQSKQSILVETISGLETIKTIPATGFLKRRWLETVDHQADTGLKSKFVAQIASNITGSAQQSMQVCIVFYGVFLIADGLLSMGALIACVIMSGRIVAPLSQLSNLLTRVNYALESYRALDRLFDDKHALHHTASLSRPTLQGRIELKNVSFKYDEEGDYIVKDLSFVIAAGEKIAMLGKIGSAKTTVLKLMTGQLEPTAGQVLIDDTDLRQLHKQDLLASLGCLMQEPFLFSGTLRQNIAVGCLDASDEDVLQAAQLSTAIDFIGSLPQGFDTFVRERGQGLSGGQRQTVTLARTLVGKPSMLLFDEPTSAMDMGTEARIISNLKQHCRDETLVVITHRTSLLALVDKVIVIDNGQLAAYGPKEQVFNPAQQAMSSGQASSHAPSGPRGPAAPPRPLASNRPGGPVAAGRGGVTAGRDGARAKPAVVSPMP